MNVVAWLRRNRCRGLTSAKARVPIHDNPVNGFEILEKVVSLPISTWRYEWEPDDVRHLGPMAQDWKVTFGLGAEDTVIPFVDANGVAMVAIQALYRRVVELERQLALMNSSHDESPCTPSAPGEAIPES